MAITLTKERSISSGVHQHISCSLCKAWHQRLRKHRVLKYKSGLHRYIQTKMDFLNIEILSSAFKYASKIEEKFKQRGRRENPMNKKWKGEGNKKMGKQIAKEPSPNSPAKKTWGVKKIGQESSMWCEVHKSPSHNTKDCRIIKNLMM